jgi:hypothetical protein
LNAEVLDWEDLIVLFRRFQSVWEMTEKLRTASRRVAIGSEEWGRQWGIKCGDEIFWKDLILEKE